MARSVLILSHGTQVSGAERSVLALASSLDPRRYTARVAAPGEGPFLAAARAAGVGASSLALSDASLRSPSSVIRNLRVLRAESRSRPFSLLHANSFLAAKQAALSTLLGDVVMVTSIRDIVPLTRPTLAALLRSRFVACVSEATTLHVRSLLPERLHRRIRTVYNGVDPAAMRLGAPSPRERILGVDAGSDVTIGMLAPLVRWKGQDLLLRAAREAVRRGATPLRVVLAGGEQFCEPGYLAELHELARSPELADRVHMLGHREDVAELLAALDLVVCASTSPDPFPRALLEAMAAGRAVIGPSAGGVPEQITDGESGWLFPPGDETRLAELIARLAGDEAARRRAGRSAAQRVAREFSLERHAEAMQSLYDEALGPA